MSTDSAFDLETYKKDKKVCIRVESFWQEAIATNMETQEFKFTAQGTGESYDHCVKISFDDGKVEDCDNVDQYNVIEVISQHLISKGAFNK